MIEQRMIEGWSFPIFTFREERHIFLKDANLNTVAFMPVWELDYYRWLCGNTFVFRSVRVDGRAGDPVRIVIPNGVMSSLPTVMFWANGELDYCGRTKDRHVFEAVGRWRMTGFEAQTDHRELWGPNGTPWRWQSF